MGTFLIFFSMLRTRTQQLCRVEIWDSGLKERLVKGFTEQSISDPSTKASLLPVARFVSMLYDFKVLRRDKWPTARIIQDMHFRKYAEEVFTKPSYGAEPPPMLSLDECIKWMSYYRVIGINEKTK